MQHKLEFNILKSNSFCSQMLRVFLRGILTVILLTFVSIEIQLFTILDHKAICVQTFYFFTKENLSESFTNFNRLGDEYLFQYESPLLVPPVFIETVMEKIHNHFRFWVFYFREVNV